MCARWMGVNRCWRCKCTYVADSTQDSRSIWQRRCWKKHGVCTPSLWSLFRSSMSDWSAGCGYLWPVYSSHHGSTRGKYSSERVWLVPSGMEYEDI